MAEIGSEVFSGELMPDLSSQYRVGKYLGSGTNDSAYLVNDNNLQSFVALTPNLYPSPEANWQRTKHKLEKAAVLDKMGLAYHVVHPIAKGLLPLRQASSSTDMALVVEYAGEPIETAQSESEKLEILKQVWQVTKTIHENGYAINDFKDEHWLFQNSNGGLQVKLIDYTQLSTVSPESMERNRNDHRKGDMRKFWYLAASFFPWFKPEAVPTFSTETAKVIQKEIDQMLVDLGEQSHRFTPKQKIAKALIGKLRTRLKGI
ncbi:MAG: hypothetical protein ABIB61_04820 [Candidatus Shapirobacteria bacterium]